MSALTDLDYLNPGPVAPPLSFSGPYRANTRCQLIFRHRPRGAPRASPVSGRPASAGWECNADLLGHPLGQCQRCRVGRRWLRRLVQGLGQWTRLSSSHAEARAAVPPAMSCLISPVSRSTEQGDSFFLFVHPDVSVLVLETCLHVVAFLCRDLLLSMPGEGNNTRARSSRVTSWRVSNPGSQALRGSTTCIAGQIVRLQPASP